MLENIFDDPCSIGKCVCLLVVSHSCIQDLLSKIVTLLHLVALFSFTFDNRNASKELQEEGEESAEPSQRAQPQSELRHPQEHAARDKTTNY